MKESQDCTAFDVNVIGLGYIGLPTAVFLAKSGFNVCGVDIDEKRVESVNRGQLPFTEDGLENLLQASVQQGKLQASTSPAVAAVHIIAVPTPVNGDHKVDLKYIESAVKTFSNVLVGGELVILESTSPPGTTHQIRELVSSLRPDLQIATETKDGVKFAHCPERVIPGNIVEEMVSNDRIVGGLTAKASSLAKDLYQSFCQGQILMSDAKTAEMAKLTENTYRDVNIAFANELSLICDNLGIDVNRVIELANHHPRVKILQPGPGVGGHCIAVDPWFIASASPKESRLIRTAREVNDSKPDFVVEKVLTEARDNSVSNIAIYGLTFKPNVDDTRNSPAIEIATKLAESKHFSKIVVVDPFVEECPDVLSSLGIELVSHRQASSIAEQAVLLVPHDAFRDEVQHITEARIVSDFCGLLEGQILR